jgi:hypothetical protein
VEYLIYQGVVSFGIDMYLAAAFTLVIPSLCSDQVFYTIEPLKGTSMIPTMEFPASFLHDRGRLDVGDCCFPCQIGQHLNACCEKKEDGKSGVLLNPPQTVLRAEQNNFEWCRWVYNFNNDCSKGGKT